MAELRERDGLGARALEFSILNAARTEDTLGGKWAEIDEVDWTWTVPGARLKGRKGARKRDHVILLSDRAIRILQDLPRDGEYIFAGGSDDGGLSNNAMAAVIDRMNAERGAAGRPKWIDPQLQREAVPHGFRSTFLDWGHDITVYPKEMLDIALAHTVSDKVEAAYRRGDMREKRRRLMADWAAYCESSSSVSKRKVVPIRA